MKKFCLFLALSLFFSCSDDDNTTDNDDNNNNGGNKITFLIGHEGNNTHTEGLYEVTYNSGVVSKTLVSTVFPDGLRLANMDYNNGHLTFVSNTDRIMYGNTSSYSFDTIPDVPSSTDGFIYVNDNFTVPRALEDGRIVYRITFEQDNWASDFEEGQFATYNPATGLTELSGELTTFIKAQPELEWDTELGSTTREFALSPDERYIYFTAYGFGVDAGSIHWDYYILTRYDYQTGNYTRIAATKSKVMSVSADGRYLFTRNYPNLDVYDVSNLSSTNDIEPMVFSDFNVSEVLDGQTGNTGAKVLFTMRGTEGFVTLYDAHSNSAVELATPTSLLPRDFRGLGYGAQFSKDDKYTYFTASDDINTNYDVEFDVLRVNNSNPAEVDSLFTLEEGFLIDLFFIMD